MATFNIPRKAPRKRSAARTFGMKRPHIPSFPYLCYKRPYAGRTTAQRGAEQLSRQYGRPMEAYRCGNCGYWHVGGK